ncbi:DUF4157 domain-containing protein [Actinokineospora globicatena]|uniref:eCIS core domain-containing protein n=1 Tax=Actinokineospora globicatena TaxID=103729 RepID=UPI0020A57681|nr:DUF4157 domain-containing protein [Actinokineospora globicatena]MCP2303500.1 protein of unknown function (DUF4157) [Actinokineospora globicatena]GLW79366.1 hypothetical protein Aglo01_38480 [Actinokineospora globicatena]GLW86224.1 hypothetical protein Aglo02_38630 [Actinokineospora globicatena]
MHEHEQDRPERRTAPHRAAQPEDQGPATRTVHDLQRSLGNAAVARLLSGEEQDETTEPSGVHDVLTGAGRPLDAGKRADMESRLGADFSTVRVHNDTAAARSADEIGARAYTSGEHVVLGRGGSDDHTLAHELWHVVQQREGPVSATDHGNGVALSDPGDRFERAAEDVATRAMSGPAPETDHSGHSHEHTTPASGQPAVQRSPRDWRNSDDVRAALAAEPGSMGLRRSFWPAIGEAVRAYISIQDNDQLDQRRDTLNTLEEAIQAWEENQRGTVTLNIVQARAKRATVAALVQLIATERREIRTATAPPQASASTPMAMPGASAARPMAMGGPSRGRAREESDDSSPEGRIDMAGLRDRFASTANLPPGIDIHAHLTRGRNIPAIHDQGLMPGASRGIGLPDTDREPDTSYTYLLSGSPPAARFVSQEAGGRTVGVVSSNVDFGPDTNYSGGSYMHHGGVPPVRDNSNQPGDGPFSFTLPATPRTRQGLRDFVNGHLPAGQHQLTEAEAMERVLAALWRTFGIRAAGDLSRG